MKINKTILFSLITLSAVFSSCTKDGEYEIHETKTFLFTEDFTEAEDNTNLDTTGWTNLAQTGTKKWVEQSFKGNGYAEFSSFGSGQAVNVGWLISPALNMDSHEGEKLFFQSAQNFLRSRDNSLELMVSTDFDGTNFDNSSWENISVITPTPETERFLFVSSGIIDLSKYTGTLHFAFRVKGSGTNSNLTGTYQIDNIKVYY
jgi:hypothetical protein